MKNAINRPTRVNVLSWAACAALAASLGLPSVAAANDTQAENLEFIIVVKFVTTGRTIC